MSAIGGKADITETEVCSAARHYLDLRLATAWRPAILPNTKARKIDTAFGAVA